MTFNFSKANDLAREVAKKTEASILDQLNDHISRGLIIIEQTDPQFVTDINNPNKLEVRTSVRLKLKEQEYIEKMEAEITFLKKQLYFASGMLSTMDKFSKMHPEAVMNYVKEHTKDKE